MNAQESEKHSSHDESLDAVYEKEIQRNHAPRTGLVQVRTKEVRATTMNRFAHLERSRSMEAPSPVSEVAWFI
jgi:hypothetical protein